MLLNKPTSGIDSIEETLAWASIFNHHLTSEELHHNLLRKMSIDDMNDIIDSSDDIQRKNGHILTSSYPVNASIREWKKNANMMLSITENVLAILASCRMVTGLAITGSVAAGVCQDGGDVDVLIITRKNWVWRVRALAIYLAHNHESGEYLCPNMVLDEESLEIEPSIYAARELMQIIPVKDTGGLTSLYEANQWATEMLPNSKAKQTISVSGEKSYPWWWSIMRLPIFGNFIESWEANRRIKELTKHSTSTEAIYTRSVCRGHENEHKKRIENEYIQVVGDSNGQ